MHNLFIKRFFQLRDAVVRALNLKQEKDTVENEYNELKSMFDTANECLEMLQNVQVQIITRSLSI